MLKLLALVTLFCIQVTFSSGTLCPYGWKKLNSSCYLFVDKQVTWDIAREDCQKLGGDLALPTDSYQNDLIAAEAKKRKFRIPWIGIFRRYDKNFTTVNGKKPSYTNFKPGQPDYHLANENCGHMYAYQPNQKLGKWNDIPCSNEYRYVCQVKLTEYVDKCLSEPCHIGGNCSNTSRFCSCGVCKPAKTGESVTKGKFSWQNTPGNHFAFAKCPYGSNQPFGGKTLGVDEKNDTFGMAHRYCACSIDTSGTPYWLDPDTSQCKYRALSDSKVTDELFLLYQGLKNGNESVVVNASNRLVELTRSSRHFSPDDAKLTVLNLEKIVRRRDLLNETGHNIVKTVDNFLNIDPSIQLKNQKTSNSSAR